MAHNPNYPRCWKKVSLIIRRLAHGRCEWCRQRCRMWELSVHHLGAPYADGKPGDAHDKHDLRRENLVALCWDCHRAADAKTYARCKERKAKREQHASLGVGTGLVIWRPPCCNPCPAVTVARDLVDRDARSPVTRARWRGISVRNIRSHTPPQWCVLRGDEGGGSRCLTTHSRLSDRETTRVRAALWRNINVTGAGLASKCDAVGAVTTRSRAG